MNGIWYNNTTVGMFIDKTMETIVIKIVIKAKTHKESFELQEFIKQHLLEVDV